MEMEMEMIVTGSNVV